ncbi:unnamed protein product [Cylindrotheca closterium]|uniref:Uncharacterized protein n=1 Tax=Cylindrotheca closterium TaxID=2856 RepID=A0AAD2PY27_9STRA|nr:unnamed protein product [Cylindrotheca closterium]
MERFTVAISTQLKVKASAQRAWVRLHEFENLHNVFSSVHSAESVGSPWVVGSKIKVTRKLPTGHCFLATYNIVKHDEENMEFQFYSEDIASPGAATVSTSWKVESLGGEDSCMVTISIAVAPRKMFVSAGRLIFAPLLRRMVNKTINQDLKDLAASFETEKELQKALLQHTTIASRPVSLANARKFKEPKEAMMFPVIVVLH